MVQVSTPGPCSAFVCSQGTNCSDAFGCGNLPVDFSIKRHDTKPEFKVKVQKCDGTPMDLTDLILEVSMWARAKLKTTITVDDSYIALADNVGFEQCKIGDVIVMDRVRAPEQMLIIGFDEDLKLIEVQRGYNGSLVNSYKKGSVLRIFRVLNSVGTIEMDKEDITQIDGTTLTDVVVESRLIYEWQAQDTCLPGCFFLEFKLIKMTSDEDSLELRNLGATPSFVQYTDDQMGCDIGSGVEWVQRFPPDFEGYVIKVVQSPTSESLL